MDEVELSRRARRASPRPTRARIVAAVLVPVAALALGLGLTLPLVTLDRLYFFTEHPSLIEIVAGLWRDGSVALALVVSLVSIVFPVAKLLWLQLVAAGITTRGLGHLHTLGRWSMMDVLVVALVVFGAKTSGLATAIAQPGLWFYAGATLAAAASSALLERAGPRWIDADVKRDPAAGPT
ncbi:MAG TPA: paraquat-inducible protein A [Methylomirabilota bacterium]|nr:paraquat-inducible protein A [Methylomirabilota bacterium]